MVSLALWVTRFLARHRFLFASFIVIWIVGMAITICLIGRTDDSKTKYPDTTAVLFNSGHNAQLSHSLTKAKAMKYCNPYNSKSLWQEGQVPNSNFTLEAVAILVRHGERMPLRRVRNQHLLSCRQPPSLEPPSSSKNSPLHAFVSLITKHPLLPLKNIFSTIATHPNQSSCAEGQLTWEGVAQHVAMGSRLHDAYHAGPWKLLPNNWDTRFVKLYSTVFSRTYQSALAFLYGFLPSFSLDKLRLIPSRDINFCLSPHCACPQLKTYEQLFTRKTKLMLKNHPAVVQLLATLGQVLSPQGNGSEFVAPRPIMDGLMGFVCQRKPLPCADHQCATMEHVGNVISYVDWEGRQLSQDLSFRRSSILKAHHLLARIHRGLRDFLEGASKTSFLFFSGHDINLIPVASTLGFDDGTIPPYASRIVLEAYSNTRKERFLRVLFNGKDMTRHTHFCRNLRADVELCPFGNFTTFLQRDVFKLFSAQSFAAACGLDGARSTATVSSPV